MTTGRLFGCGTAIVTPFLADGSVDEPALRALVAARWLVGRKGTYTMRDVVARGGSDA